MLKDPFSMVFFCVVIIYTISLIIPAAWAIISTFKDRLEFRFNMFGLPDSPTLENYRSVFAKMYITISSDKTGLEKIYMPELMFNGLALSICVALGSLAMQTGITYCCAKFDTVVGKIIVGFVIVTMILPIVGNLGTSIYVSKKVLNTYDNFFGIVFSHSGWGGSAFLIIYAAFKSVSNEYRDAAYLDGASEYQVLWRIMLPMVKNTLVALFIMSFISGWNDYQTPMIYLPSMPTIAYGLFQFRYSSDSLVSAIPMQITGCIVVMVPIFILFLIFKNKMMGNLTMGGLKG